MVKVKTNIELGDIVQDSITGFKGVAVAYIQYLNGCERISIQSKTLKDGKVVDTEWIDVQQLKIVTPINKVSKAKKELTGGPPGKQPKAAFNVPKRTL